MCKKDKFVSSSLDRRSFLKETSKVTLAAGALSMVGCRRGTTANDQNPVETQKSPHYFLHIQISGGLDVQYAFDARPLDMTAQKLISNYIGEDPTVYQGSNGQSTLRTSLTDPLMKWSDRFSLINGVIMSPSFEGHDQGTNILFTGSPFGGESFIPWANHGKTTLDYVESGFLFASISNSGGAMQLDPKGCQALGAKIGSLGSRAATMSAIQRRADRVGLGKSSLAQASRSLASSLGGVPAFAQSFSSVKLSEPDAFDQNDERAKLLSETKSNIEMFSVLMRVGITNSAVLNINLNMDAHDEATARGLPLRVKNISEAVSYIFEYLNNAPAPSGGSMLENTTILIGSEFGRTMRQQYASFETTGTDHNPLTNTLILAGKGVRGGQVFGQSDFQTAGEQLSPAHLALDPDKIKVMGKPFDAVSGTVRAEAMPETFDPTMYLGAANVINTLQEILGISSEKRFTYGRNLPTVPVISGLIA